MNVLLSMRSPMTACTCGISDGGTPHVSSISVGPDMRKEKEMGEGVERKGEGPRKREREGRRGRKGGKEGGEREERMRKRWRMRDRKDEAERKRKRRRIREI